MRDLRSDLADSWWSQNSITGLEALTYKGPDETKLTFTEGDKQASFSLTAGSLQQDFVLSIKLSERLQDVAWIEGEGVTPQHSGRSMRWAPDS